MYVLYRAYAGMPWVSVIPGKINIKEQGILGSKEQQGTGSTRENGILGNR
jgi:hypothetical protein